MSATAADNGIDLGRPVATQAADGLPLGSPPARAAERCALAWCCRFESRQPGDHRRLHRWSRRGLWHRLLQAPAVAEPGEVHLLDSTSAKAYRSAAGPKGGLRAGDRPLTWGRTTKIQDVVDGRGRPLTFTLSAGQRGGAPLAPALIEALPAPRICAADTAYDSGALRWLLIARGTPPVIPNNPTRKRCHPFDPSLSRLRSLIERASCRLKDRRRIATRYDKLAANYAAAIAIVVMWWS